MFSLVQLNELIERESVCSEQVKRLPVKVKNELLESRLSVNGLLVRSEYKSWFKPSSPLTGLVWPNVCEGHLCGSVWLRLKAIRTGTKIIIWTVCAGHLPLNWVVLPVHNRERLVSRCLTIIQDTWKVKKDAVVAALASGRIRPLLCAGCAASP